jgi:hypothetical protein
MPADTITTHDAQEIHRKLDMILSAMGLSENRRLAPVEAQQIAKGIVLNYQRRQGAKK